MISVQYHLRYTSSFNESFNKVYYYIPPKSKTPDETLYPLYSPAPNNHCNNPKTAP